MAVDDGRLLGDRYRVGAFLGQGGAAAVYEAVDTVLGRRVAVKLYQATDPLGRFRFASEARLLAGLSHPGLVTVYDVSLDGDQPYLVMRLVDGPTLRDLLGRGPFEPAVVARIGATLTGALAHVHAKDVVHRDIKPSNVLFDASGTCLLADFGLARALSATHLTGPGEYVGTAAYLAPEQITDVDVGPAADIYALGLVLLECLTGQPEYDGTAAETAMARLARAPRIPGSLPAGWRSLLTAMTSQDPAQRPTAETCARLLTGLTGQQAETTVVVPAPRPASHRPRAMYAGVAALALAAVAIVLATSTDAIPGRPVGDPTSRVTEAVHTTPEAPPVPSPTRVVPPPPAEPVAEPPAGPPAPAPGPGEKPDKSGKDQGGENKGKGSGPGRP